MGIVRERGGEGRLDAAGLVGLLGVGVILVGSVYALWPAHAKPMAGLRVASDGAPPRRTFERVLPGPGERLVLTTMRDGEAPERLAVVTTAPPPTKEGTPPEADRLGCRVDREPPPDAGATTVHLTSTCSFRRSSDGAVHALSLPSSDLFTFEGEGDPVDTMMASPDAHWSAEAQTAFRLASVPVPASTAIGPGASWRLDEEITIGGLRVSRRSAYTLVEWTGGGARIEVDVEETTPEQDVDQGAAASRALAQKITERTGAPVGLDLPLGTVHVRGGRLHARGSLEVVSGATFPVGELSVESSPGPLRSRFRYER